MISFCIFHFFNIIIIIMLLTVLFSWFPNINRNREPFKSILKIGESVIAPFRGIIPCVGMFDFSPILAFIFVEFVQWALVKFFLSLGL